MQISGFVTKIIFCCVMFRTEFAGEFVYCDEGGDIKLKREKERRRGDQCLHWTHDGINLNSFR
jgi:hypothetical protein